MKTQCLIVFLMLSLHCISLPAAEPDIQDPFNLGSFVIEHRLHKATGIAAIATATAVAAMGFFEAEDLHPVAGYTAFGLMSVNTVFGIAAYHDYLSVYWPHIALNTLALTGFALNAFVLEPGTDAHIASGASSLASMYAALGFVVYLNW